MGQIPVCAVLFSWVAFVLKGKVTRVDLQGLDLKNIPQKSEGRIRLGVMGGTFDPIHHGHLVAASEVAAILELDEVVFVPTGMPWQKAGTRSITDAEHRYLMTVIATASNPRFTVSRIDIDREVPTITFDTLNDLKRLRPHADLFFITGADAMNQIMTWKNADKLWDLANFVGVTRPGHELTMPEIGREKISLLEVPAMAISSTDVRTRAAAKMPVWYLVPDGVVQYINKYELYAGGDVASGTEHHYEDGLPSSSFEEYVL